MTPQTASTDDWEDCPEGTLQALANRSRRQRTVKRAAWAIPLTLATLFSLAWGGWLPLPYNLNSATLACDQVVALLPAYSANSLAAPLRAQVEQHLKKCPLCAAKLRTITRSVAAAIKHFDQPTQPVATHRSESLFVAGHLSSHHF